MSLLQNLFRGMVWLEQIFWGVMLQHLSIMPNCKKFGCLKGYKAITKIKLNFNNFLSIYTLDVAKLKKMIVNNLFKKLKQEKVNGFRYWL